MYSANTYNMMYIWCIEVLGFDSWMRATETCCWRWVEPSANYRPLARWLYGNASCLWAVQELHGEGRSEKTRCPRCVMKLRASESITWFITDTTGFYWLNCASPLCLSQSSSFAPAKLTLKPLSRGLLIVFCLLFIIWMLLANCTQEVYTFGQPRCLHAAIESKCTCGHNGWAAPSPIPIKLHQTYQTHINPSTSLRSGTTWKAR